MEHLQWSSKINARYVGLKKRKIESRIFIFMRIQGVNKKYWDWDYKKKYTTY